MAETRTRWPFIDSLRGFAILGILLVNAIDITELGMARLLEGGSRVPDPVRDTLYLTVQTRFVPIFILLFGMSLWMVLDSARARSPRPWLVMVRRMVVLAVIGGLLMFAYPGNILLEYGVVGLLMLPVVLLAPRWATLVGGAVLTVVAYAMFGGGLPSVPGLILLGAGAAAFGLPRALESSGKAVAITFTAAAVLTVPALLWQLTTPGDPRFSTPGGIAGLVMAVLYTTGLALLWRTRARTAIAAIFEPLGRMALSNYVGAAIVMALAASVVDFGHMTAVTPVVALSLAVIVVQSLLSRLWLAHFRYGPVEWLWRTATWLRPVTLRREASQ
ncbi:DUF418 domain-containing protein [Myceligenerans xiligouense]|uniref:DUF418 domain-containing protein n=1 Tax=Myceligenerans xiligouense TaxID=253184 RepID=UPI0014771FC9|nr:DUF418 domain-containing protein [Myceligenerans xiligouense]